MKRLIPEARPSVLIVDSDAPVRRMVASLLEADGCRVMHANSVRSALQLITAFTPDLIISDDALPTVSEVRVVAKPVNLTTLVALLDAVEAVRPRGAQAGRQTGRFS